MKNETFFGKYFKGRGLLVNGLIAMIPAGIVIAFLGSSGIRGGLVTAGVFFLFVFIVGSIRDLEGQNKTTNEVKVEEPKDTKEEVKKGKTLLDKIISKIKSNKIVQISIVILVIFVVIKIYNNKIEKQKWACLQEIMYWDSDNTYNYLDTDFRTQNEALDYCLLSKKYQD